MKTTLLLVRNGAGRKNLKSLIDKVLNCIFEYFIMF